MLMYILAGVIGLIMGMVITFFLCYRRAKFGIFEVNTSDPNVIACRLKIDTLDDIDCKRNVILKIKHVRTTQK